MDLLGLIFRTLRVHTTILDNRGSGHQIVMHSLIENRKRRICIEVFSRELCTVLRTADIDTYGQ